MSSMECSHDEKRKGRAMPDDGARMIGNSMAARAMGDWLHIDVLAMKPPWGKSRNGGKFSRPGNLPALDHSPPRLSVDSLPLAG
jgi:hypothetical protein